jgi:hypothetical protein
MADWQNIQTFEEWWDRVGRLIADDEARAHAAFDFGYLLRATEPHPKDTER